MAEINDIFGGFNPRPREGGDLELGRDPQANHVSIRAPVKGATVVVWEVGGGWGFQSAPP